MGNNNAAADDDKAALDASDLQKTIQEAVDKATAGLKAKNYELLGEVKQTKEALKAWEGFDPDNVKKIITQFENDDDAKLIRDGKFNEVIDRRTKETITRAQAQVEKETKAREDAFKRAEELQAKYHAAIVDNKVAQQVTGLADGALAPVQLFARQWFTVDADSGDIKPTDKAPLWPAAEPLTIEKLKDYLQTAASFYFKQPVGGGAVAGKMGGTPQKKRAEMEPAERARLISEIGSEAYLKLP